MAAECLAAIHLCRVRATRLNTDGTVADGPNNVFVTDKPVVIEVTPVIVTGEDKDVVGGCDCLVATYKGRDKLKRFDLSMDIARLEIGLIEMLLGSTVVLNETDDPIGQWWTEQAFDCGGTNVAVALEGWQTGWDESAPSATFPYVHWIWPSTSWQIGAHSLQNDFLQPKLTGFSRKNSSWGTGPWEDLPEAAGPLGGFVYDDAIPEADCDYQTAPIPAT